MGNTGNRSMDGEGPRSGPKGRVAWPMMAMALLSGHLIATESAAVPTEEDFLGDIPVVLSVTRLSQPRSEAPAAITVIDRRMIEASGARSIPELMRMVPGFQVGHDEDSLLAPRQTPVTYHGYSDAFSRKMQVLIDGRSVYDPMFGGVRWSELGVALEDIERIEVIRGPNAVSYGANAFLGVINIITRHPVQDAGFSAGVEGATGGYQRGIVRYSNDNERYDHRLTVLSMRQDGLQNLYDSSDSTELAYRGELKLGSKDTLSLNLGYNQGLRQMGDADAATMPTNPYHDAQTTNHHQQVSWVRRLSPDQDLSFQVYHNYSQFDNTYIGYFDPDGGGPFPALATSIVADTRTHRWDAEFQHTLRVSGNLRLVWGAEVRQDEAWAPDWFTTNKWQRKQLYRLFGNSEWRMGPHLTSNIGLMVEHSSDVGTNYSPRLAFNFLPTEHHAFRASVSQANRNPSLFEQYANTTVNIGNVVPPTELVLQYFYGDGNVGPGKLTAYELGYLYDNPKHGLSLDTKLFSMRFRDSIAYPSDLDTLIGTYTYLNGGDSDINGFELQMKYQPVRGTTLATTYAYAEHTGWYTAAIGPAPAPPTPGSSDASTPAHTFSLLLAQDFGHSWTAGLFYYWVSEAGWFSSATQGYHILNARLAKTFQIGGRKMQLELLGQNLAGSYRDFDNNAVLDRRYYLGIKIPF